LFKVWFQTAALSQNKHPLILIAHFQFLFHFKVVAQPALGRGLGDLLNGTKVVPDLNGSVQAPECSAPARMSAGVETLMRGSQTQPLPPDTTTGKLPALGLNLIFWSLIAADLVLCGLVTVFWMSGLGLTGFIRFLVVFFALAMGAWLSCMAMWLKLRR
jgi:hypothetical protein